MAAALEICVDTPDGLAAALAGGADRIELCSALALGGLTPSAGLVAAAAGAGVPVRAMIRPRAGGFVLSPADLEVSLGDLRAMRAAGLEGVVLGAARADGSLDTEALARLREAAGPMAATLHRVFDLTPDPEAALEQAIDLGFDCILTSGQAPSAPAGAALIARLTERAQGRIAIMAGGGVTAQAAPALIETGAAWLHASCKGDDETAPALMALGAPARTDAARIEALRRAMTTTEAGVPA
ncbi:copper homeostasis protein CutC [Pseudoroseicyclus aestuarii]|uniref:PF03932 family protein CutC n=1 Tax=Pseudoroseicyclus aestuarii TaxID=1795041 RepID=A0A318SZ42_9RHOB|nr:copper homeostasis protein CutC [Pseudoroseicyclus aestuarii]PYE85676.1 copper homeostasis protein CutC [Pseudoroseicyclus aestuarii]